MLLSACVIVKNEEHTIENWLRCMKKITHEMIVVDTGSTDLTLQIAQSYGAKVFSYQWQEDFSAAKNYAIQKATGDWILFLDADETFTEESRQALPQLLKQYHHRKEIDGMVCRILNIDVDANNKIISIVSNVRIFRNRPYLRYHGKVHEVLENSLKKIGLISLDQSLVIYHTGYSTSIIRKKLQRNLELLLNDVKINGERPEIYHYLCTCYHGLGDDEKTIEYAQKHIQSRYRIIGGDHEIYKRWIDGLVRSGRDMEIVFKAIEQARKKYPKEPTFIFCKGDFLLQLKRYKEAEAHLLEAVALDLKNQEEPEQAEYAVDLFVNFRPKLYYDLGLLMEQKKRTDQAAAYYLDSLRLYRYDEESFLAFYRLLSVLEDIEIIECLNAVYQVNSVDDLKFLIAAFKRCAPSKVEVYYKKQAIQKGVEVFRQPARDLWAVGKKEPALQLMTEDLEAAYMDLIAAAVGLYGHQAWTKIGVFLPENYKIVLHAILQQERSVDLNDSQRQLFQEILERLGALGILEPVQ